MTYLTFKLRSGRQYHGLKFKKSSFELTEMSSKRDRVSQVFLARLATYYRFNVNPSLFDSNPLSRKDYEELKPF